MPEWPRKRTSVWRRVAWSWRGATGVHAKKSPNLVMYVSALVIFQYQTWIHSSIEILCFLRQSESPTNASIPELERQIDKLTKVSLMLHRRSALYICVASF